MAGFTMATAGPLLKEKFDPVIVQAMVRRNTTFAWFLKKIETVDINDRGYIYTVKTRMNQGYGSAVVEGDLLPRPGAPAFQRVRADYLDHFLSGEITGRIRDAKDDGALINLVRPNMEDATDSFATFQDIYMFGDGTGTLAVLSAAYNSGTPTILTAAPSQARPLGAKNIQPTQRIQVINPANGAQRTGGSVTVSTAVARDIVTGNITFDAVPTDAAIGDILVIENTYGRETQGFAYHIDNAANNWLKDGTTGSALARASNPFANANVIDEGAASITPQMLDTIDLQAGNQIGDGAPAYNHVMLSHRAQQNQYRQLGYALTRTVTATPGGQKLDLGFGDVSHNGMEWRTSSNCPADRIYGLQLDNWKLAAVKLPQMYEFDNGITLIQKPSTDRYYDAQQFAVYGRFNFICNNPSSQFLLKNLAFNVADVRVNLF